MRLHIKAQLPLKRGKLYLQVQLRLKKFKKRFM